MLVFPHDDDLIDDQLLLRLLRQVHLLNGDLVASGNVLRRVHSAGRSATRKFQHQ